MTIDTKRVITQVMIAAFLSLPGMLIFFPSERPFNISIMIAVVLLFASARNAETARSNQNEHLVFFWNRMCLAVVAMVFGSITALLWNLSLPAEFAWLNQVAFPLTFFVGSLYITVINGFIKHFSAAD